MKAADTPLIIHREGAASKVTRESGDLPVDYSSRAFVGEAPKLRLCILTCSVPHFLF